MSVDLAFAEASVPPDEAPPHVEEALSGHRCTECGKELYYGGRGRPPTKCEEHRKTASKGSGGSGRKSGSNKTNESLAAQATEALIQINGIVAFSALCAGLKYTKEAIKDAEEEFRELTYNALLTDPGMCRQILSVGSVSGKLSLLMAYGMLAGAVGPVAYMELQMKKVERAEKRLAAENAV